LFRDATVNEKKAEILCDVAGAKVEKLITNGG
jgi:hypothetical protein